VSHRDNLSLFIRVTTDYRPARGSIEINVQLCPRLHSGAVAGDTMSRKPDSRSAEPTPPALSRRTLFAGAGTAGAVAAAAALLPGTQADPSVAAAGSADPGEGYRLTEHVKRYYQTARV
jgi:hypothetical protein